MSKRKKEVQGADVQRDGADQLALLVEQPPHRYPQQRLVLERLDEQQRHAHEGCEPGLLSDAMTHGASVIL